MTPILMVVLVMLAVMVQTGCPFYFQNKFHIFGHRIPCEFLRKLFMPRIRFVVLILAKIEGVNV